METRALLDCGADDERMCRRFPSMTLVIDVAGERLAVDTFEQEQAYEIQRANQYFARRIQAQHRSSILQAKHKQ